MHARTQDGATPLHAAAQNGHELAVVALVAAGAKIEAADRVREAILLLLKKLAFASAA